MRFSIILILLVSLCHVMAQDLKPVISLDEISFDDGVSASSILRTTLSKRLGKQYTVSDDSPLGVSLLISLGDQRKISGMDTYYIMEASVEYTVSNPAMSCESITDSYTTAIKSSDASSSTRTISAALAKDKKLSESLLSTLSEFTESCSVTCDDYTARVRHALDHDDPATAYSLYTYAVMSECNDLSTVESDLVSAYAVKFCEDQIDNLTIMSHSSIPREMRKAIQIMKAIPAGAPCKEEAVALSQVIGNNYKEIKVDKDDDFVSRLEETLLPPSADYNAWYLREYLPRKIF